MSVWIVPACQIAAELPAKYLLSYVSNFPVKFCLQSCLIKMSTSLAVGMIFLSLDAAKDAFSRGAVARCRSYISHNQTANYFTAKECCSKDCSSYVQFTLKS